jgi:hypothetical protein
VLATGDAPGHPASAARLTAVVSVKLRAGQFNGGVDYDRAICCITRKDLR